MSFELSICSTLFTISWAHYVSINVFVLYLKMCTNETEARVITEKNHSSKRMPMFCYCWFSQWFLSTRLFTSSEWLEWVYDADFIPQVWISSTYRTKFVNFDLGKVQLHIGQIYLRDIAKFIWIHQSFSGGFADSSWHSSWLCQKEGWCYICCFLFPYKFVALL